MTENDSSKIQGNSSPKSTPFNIPPLSGARYSQTILVQDSSPSGSESPEMVSGEKAHILTDVPDKESQKDLGPSAFEGTGNPYLAKVFEITSTDIRNLSLGEPLETVDSFILSLVKERNWVDNADSYNRVLAELRSNLGIDPNLQPLIALERLAKGVKLLRLQNMHRRRDQQIQKQINKINNENSRKTTTCKI